MEARLPSKQVLGLTPTHVITLKQVRHKKRSDNDKYTLELDLRLYYALRVDDPRTNCRRNITSISFLLTSISISTNFINSTLYYVDINILLKWAGIYLLKRHDVSLRSRLRKMKMHIAISLHNLCVTSRDYNESDYS